jgi:hypothetical protein
VLADSQANGTLLALQIQAGVGVYITDKGNRLRKVDMDSFVERQILIVRVGDLDRAVLRAGRTACAPVFDDVSRPFGQGDFEISRFTLHPVNVGMCQEHDVRMPAAFEKFWRLDTHGAVIGGEGLIELGHLATDGRRLVNEVDLETGAGKIERSLYTADPAADNQDIAEIIIGGIVGGASFKRFLNHFTCPCTLALSH